jgi:hypothetical protein
MIIHQFHEEIESFVRAIKYFHVSVAQRTPQEAIKLGQRLPMPDTCPFIPITNAHCNRTKHTFCGRAPTWNYGSMCEMRLFS